MAAKSVKAVCLSSCGCCGTFPIFELKLAHTRCNHAGFLETIKLWRWTLAILFKSPIPTWKNPICGKDTNGDEISTRPRADTFQHTKPKRGTKSLISPQKKLILSNQVVRIIWTKINTSNQMKSLYTFLCLPVEKYISLFQSCQFLSPLKPWSCTEPSYRNENFP